MLHKLLKKNISFTQFAGYSIAALVGMTVIFIAFCFWMDVRPLFSSDQTIFKKELLIINKKVSILAAFGKNKAVFSEEEINEIKKQSFVRSVESFVPSRFKVTGYTDPVGQMGAFSTEMFFESVPDRLIDNPGPDWKWEEEKRLIPIIIPRTYLSLYNFGFAGTQQLPQLSEAIIQQITFHIVLQGNRLRETFTGRIVGFSNDLNTILVPQAFMEWANQRFGSSSQTEGFISRLILEVNNPADPAITAFFSSKPDYEINDNKGDQGKLSYFLTLMILVVFGFGILILLSAIGMMLLSINLLIYKNQEMLGNLVLLGYKRNQLALPYCYLVLFINLFVGTASFILTVQIQNIYRLKLILLGLTDFSHGLYLTAFFTAGFVLLISIIDAIWIRQKISSIKVPVKG